MSGKKRGRKLLDVTHVICNHVFKLQMGAYKVNALHNALLQVTKVRLVTTVFPCIHISDFEYRAVLGKLRMCLKDLKVGGTIHVSG
jgi:hypothetical protein